MYVLYTVYIVTNPAQSALPTISPDYFPHNPVIIINNTEFIMGSNIMHCTLDFL